MPLVNETRWRRCHAEALRHVIAGVACPSCGHSVSWLDAGFAGQEYEVGSAALVILSVAQFVIVVTGPGGFLLSMTGKQRVLRKVNIMGAVVNVTLIRCWSAVGDNGAALATASSLILMNMKLVKEARKHVGVNALPFLRLPWL